jgi:putative endonuclease
MNRSAEGRKGEAAAAEYLEAAGCTVIARNYRSRRGEVDLVALEGESILFVEVKTWRSLGMEDIGLALDVRKQGRIIETAKFFLSQNREYNGRRVRFDLVFIGPEGIRHLASAFTECV